MNELMNERVNEWVNEWMNEGMTGPTFTIINGSAAPIKDSKAARTLEMVEEFFPKTERDKWTSHPSHRRPDFGFKRSTHLESELAGTFEDFKICRYKSPVVSLMAVEISIWCFSRSSHLDISSMICDALEETSPPSSSPSELWLVGIWVVKEYIFSITLHSIHGILIQKYFFFLD